MNCHKCGNKISGDEKFCPMCGLKLVAGEPVQQPHVEHMSFARVIMSIISLFRILGIGRMAAAFLWTLLVPMQWVTDGDTLLNILNRVSPAIQFFVALALARLGFSKFNTVGLRFGSVDKFLKTSRLTIRLNDIFAGLAVLWYGYQSFLHGHNYLIVFFAIETAILLTSLLMMQKMKKKMPREARTPESDGFIKEKEDAIALSLAHYYLRNSASSGPNVKVLSPLFMQDMPVCLHRNSFCYALSIEHGYYKVAVASVGNMPEILHSEVRDDELSVEAKPVIDWIYSVLGVLPELVSLSEEEVNKVNDYRAKAARDGGKMTIGIGAAIVIVSITLSVDYYIRYGHIESLQTAPFSVLRVILGIVFIFIGVKAAKKKLGK